MNISTGFVLLMAALFGTAAIVMLALIYHDSDRPNGKKVMQ